MLVQLFQLLRWALGYAFLDLYRTVQSVLGREGLQRPSTEGMDGLNVARACLDACLEKRRVGPGKRATVLCAGFRHFREPWARDFGFASFGLIAEGKAHVVRDGVRLFFRHQKSTGQLPLKLHSTRLLERYLHSVLARVQPVDANLIPRYLTAHGTRSLDSALLLIIAWGECVLKTEDKVLGADLHGQARRALEWVERKRDQRGLINQGPFADWADSIGRRGAVLYTNVLWWKAQQSLEQVESYLELPFKPREESFEQIGARIRQHFYKDGYLHNTPTSPIFTSAENFMAVAWGLTDAAQSASILDYADRKGLSDVAVSYTHLTLPTNREV